MMNRAQMHLFHGGHKGTEAEFCRAGERWNVAQTTLSFEGHKMERATNVDVLDDQLLEEGHVSMEFVFQAMGRRFVRGTGMRRVIYSMFHFVKRSNELFAIGWIQADDTVKGGTGWGVELAKLFNRDVHVFDQDKERWFSWSNHKWEPSEPRVPAGKFAATGTRNLTAAGKQAIHDLFERSLGQASLEQAELAHSH